MTDEIFINKLTPQVPFRREIVVDVFNFYSKDRKKTEKIVKTAAQLGISPYGLLSVSKVVEFVS